MHLRIGFLHAAGEGRGAPSSCGADEVRARILDIKGEMSSGKRPASLEGPQRQAHDPSRLFAAQSGVITQPHDLTQFQVGGGKS